MYVSVFNALAISSFHIPASTPFVQNPTARIRLISLFIQLPALGPFSPIMVDCPVTHKHSMCPDSILVTSPQWRDAQGGPGFKGPGSGSKTPEVSRTHELSPSSWLPNPEF